MSLKPSSEGINSVEDKIKQFLAGKIQSELQAAKEVEEEHEEEKKEEEEEVKE